MQRRAFMIALIVGVPGAVALGQQASPAPQTVAYRIIVHRSNPMTRASRKFLTEVFLKKTTRWPNGTVIRPVDLHPSSPTRQRFTEDILRRSVSAVKNYWQQMIFTGRELPPPELSNDDAIVDYVSKHVDAIGYVSGSTNIKNTKGIALR